ncbi:MAG: DUF3696 domain-containing protein [Bdellovibrionales bacterium]
MSKSSKKCCDYQIRWKNYRPFEDTGWLTLRPITILIGTNNSGKSSVLSPLLLLNQTIKSHDVETPILTQGPLVDVGNFRDFVHLHDQSRKVFFGLRFHTHEIPNKCKPVGAYPPGGMAITFASDDKSHQIKLIKNELSDVFNRPYTAHTVGSGSTRYSLSGPLDNTGMKKREQKAIKNTVPVNFLFSPNATLYAYEKFGSVKNPSSKSEQFSKPFSHYLQVLGFTYSSIRAFFSDISYVGPLRKKLERYYRVAAESPLTVGTQGENAPNLFRQKQKLLQKETNNWIKKFEFGTALRCQNLTNDLFELLFVDGKKETNVADAGFGASQVLPLIIQALAAPKDSLTIVEQPEIHLNPRLQGTLSDLFVHMAKAGHRVLVETHSEHLLIRLRRLVASGEISSKDVGIYFVEKQNDVSKIREVTIEENGHISREQWPQGFFDDTLRESLALASAQSNSQREH